LQNLARGAFDKTYDDAGDIPALYGAGGHGDRKRARKKKKKERTYLMYATPSHIRTPLPLYSGFGSIEPSLFYFV